MISRVAAHRAVGAEAEPQAGGHHLHDGRDALRGFDVGDDVVGDADVARLQQRDVRIGDEDAMRGHEPAIEQPE